MLRRPVMALSLILLCFPLHAADDPQRVLVFGDSNSWGWIPQETGIPTERYGADTRWPGVARTALGENVEIVVDALSGRTTDVDDPTTSLSGAGLNGAEALPAVIGAHFPLDLVVIMLGTNDTKVMFERSPLRIGLGAGHLVDIVQTSGGMFGDGWYSYPAPKVLLVAPPPLAEPTILGEVFDEQSVERSRQLADVYQGIAQTAGAAFFDAGSVIGTDGVDAVHFTAESQRALGEALAGKIGEVLEAGD